MGESSVGEHIADLMVRGANPEVGTTAALGVIGIRINATASAAEAAVRMLEEAEREVRRRLGAIVFGRDDDTLAECVGRLLTERGETVCTIESCTGGLIAKELTDAPGSSAYFLGGAVTYANQAKTALVGVSEEALDQHGAVSEPVALAMATGGRTRFGSDYGIAVTGIAGPGGGSPAKPVGLVYIAVAAADGAVAWAHPFGETSPRDVIRQRAAHTALNALRLRLLDVGTSHLANPASAGATPDCRR